MIPITKALVIIQDIQMLLQKNILYEDFYTFVPEMSINKMCCNWSYTVSYYIYILRHNIVVAVTEEIVQGKEKYQIKDLCMLWHVFENPK